MLNTSSGDSIATPLVDFPDNIESQVVQASGDGQFSAYGRIPKLDERLVNPWRSVTPTLTRSKPTSSALYDHAAPLSPLRDRDLAELSGVFDRDDMPDLEQDVNQHLIRLFPEPYWEETNLEFS